MRPFACHLSLENLFKNRFLLDVGQPLQALFSGFIDDSICKKMSLYVEIMEFPDLADFASFC